LPTDVTFHPLLAAAHSCWGHAKMIALSAWAKAVENQARSTGQLVHVEEGPRRGSLQVLNARTRQVVAALNADPSFPVDGTKLVLKFLKGGDTASLV
jgi:hypothetical protein